MIQRLADLVDLSEVAAQRHRRLVWQREHILLTDARFVAIVVIVSIVSLLIIRFTMVVQSVSGRRVPEIYIFVGLLRSRNG